MNKEKNLTKKINQQIEEKRDYIQSDFDLAIEVINDLKIKILSLDYDDCIVEITPDNSIVFKLYYLIGEDNLLIFI